MGTIRPRAMESQVDDHQFSCGVVLGCLQVAPHQVLPQNFLVRTSSHAESVEWQIHDLQMEHCWWVGALRLQHAPPVHRVLPSFPVGDARCPFNFFPPDP